MAFIRRKRVSGSQLTREEIIALTDGKVIKQYKDKIVFAKPSFRPKRGRKPTPAQARRRQLMKEAVFFAKRVNADPAQRAKWKKRAKGFTNVYQAALSWYLKKESKKMKEQAPN